MGFGDSLGGDDGLSLLEGEGDGAGLSVGTLEGPVGKKLADGPEGEGDGAGLSVGTLEGPVGKKLADGPRDVVDFDGEMDGAELRSNEGTKLSDGI